MRSNLCACRHVVAAALLGFLIAVPPAAAQTPQAAATDTAKKEPLPLEPERRISYTANEGTWLSIDVSPDGRTIVFDLLGDLYTLPIEGGSATRLTSGMAFDGQPRYSPDGTKVLYVSDASGGDNLWT
ncbi:MAG: TolB family protein, partial [Longimicrobiales bacterium]